MALAGRHALLAIYAFREHVSSVITSHGDDLTNSMREVGRYTGGNFSRVKASRFAVVQPTRPELSIL
jgi:hypothetical protein